ncbi:down syndrome cell adhesion molecule [Trichonephila clavipes]|nr:down syndrome cell adhesion molecule [Trichonephila clavipes]
MSEVSQKSLSGKQSINGSHYSSPTRGQHQFASSKSGEQRRTDKQHEYAEPYTAFPSSRQRSDEGSFATIKRAPPRSGSMTSAYKTATRELTNWTRNFELWSSDEGDI